MTVVRVASPDDLLAYIIGELKVPDDLSGVELSDISRFHIKLPEGYHSEVPGPFIEAFNKKQSNLYRVIALIENGTSDTRTLTQAQYETYQYKIHVEEGSTDVEDNALSLLESLIREGISKMTPEQTFIIIGGTILLVGITWGLRSFLNYRKEIRLEEIASDERRRSLESVDLGGECLASKFQRVLEVMSEQGSIGDKVAKANEKVLDQMLRAASQVNVTEVDGVRITGEQARELRVASRRQSNTRTVTQDMRVLDVNTSDSTQTAIILENPISGEQVRATYLDRIVEGKKSDLVYKALRERGTASFKLKMRILGEDVTSTEIVDVGAAEDVGQIDGDATVSRLSR